MALNTWKVLLVMAVCCLPAFAQQRSIESEAQAWLSVVAQKNSLDEHTVRKIIGELNFSVPGFRDSSSIKLAESVELYPDNLVNTIKIADQIWTGKEYTQSEIVLIRNKAVIGVIESADLNQLVLFDSKEIKFIDFKCKNFSKYSRKYSGQLLKGSDYECNNSESAKIKENIISELLKLRNGYTTNEFILITDKLIYDKDYFLAKSMSLLDDQVNNLTTSNMNWKGQSSSQQEVVLLDSAGKVFSFLGDEAVSTQIVLFKQSEVDIIYLDNYADIKNKVMLVKYKRFKMDAN